MLLMISFVFIWCMSVVGIVGAASDPDLAVLWTFDDIHGGIAEDSSGNGNDGNVIGGVQVVEGKRDGAFQFDGKSGQVLVPNSDSIDIGGGDFSIVFWLKSKQVIGQFGATWYNAPWPIDKDVGGGVMGGDWLVSLTEGNLVFMTGDAPLVKDDLLISTDVICDGKWHHVGLTREKKSGTKTMYIDGVKDVSEVQGPDLSLSNTQDLKIGGKSGKWVEGILDDMAFYTRVLSQAEIRRAMNSGAGATAVRPMENLATTWGMIKS